MGLITLMKRVLLAISAASLVMTNASSGAEPNLRFSEIAPNEFVFDTGVLRGKLGGGGKTKGLSSVEYIPTRERLDASMGLLSHYRVFTTGKRYGTGAWDWFGSMTLRADGSVETKWPADNERPFTMTAVYRISARDTIDLETTVLPQLSLRGFEVFVASYFTKAFTNSAVCARLAADDNQAVFTFAEQRRGVWQAFVRDQASTALIRDGRWKLEPHPVDWALVGNFNKPVGLRRAPASGTAAFIMSRPEDCFGIFTPYQEEPHFSMYFSLFGRDIKPGEHASAHMRLTIKKSAKDTDALAAFSEYKTRSR